MTHTVADLIQASVALLRARRRIEARQLLEQALAREPLNDAIWLWLSGTTDDPVEQGQLLRRALACNPQNQLARRGLAALEARVAAETPPPAPAAPPSASDWPPPDQAPGAVTPEPAPPPNAAPSGWTLAQDLPPSAAPGGWTLAQDPPEPAPPPSAAPSGWTLAPDPPEPAPPPSAEEPWPATHPAPWASDPPAPAPQSHAGAAEWRSSLGAEPIPAPELVDAPAPPSSSADDPAFTAAWLDTSAPPQTASEQQEAQPIPEGAADWQTLETVGAWQALAEEEAAPEPPAAPQPWAPPAPLSAPELAELAATCAGCEAQVYGNAAFCWRCHAAIHCCATCAFAAEPACKELQQISSLTARNRCPWWRPPN